jgi:hypothetical protein
MSFFDPDVQAFVKSLYGWPQNGATLEYDYHAESKVLTHFNCFTSANVQILTQAASQVLTTN